MRAYLDGELSIQEFRSAFGALYYAAKQEDALDAQGSKLVGHIQAMLAEYSRDHRTEGSVADELEKAIRHFEQSSPVLAKFAFSPPLSIPKNKAR
ncbi:MAG: hypothetical protein ABJF23_14860 [Bryobacteraceae bacterium]